MVLPPERYGRKSGDAARQRIVAYLLEQREQGASVIIVDDLCDALKIPKTTMRHHVEWLQQQLILDVIEVPSRKLAQAVRLIEPTKRSPGAT